uniref:COMM domain-containing protein n=1 Tax=Caenorhabditis tropicalis TaxID=1561998 RepID=A0A1I7UQ64_9PELO
MSSHKQQVSGKSKVSDHLCGMLFSSVCRKKGRVQQLELNYLEIDVNRISRKDADALKTRKCENLINDLMVRQKLLKFSS